MIGFLESFGEAAHAAPAPAFARSAAALASLRTAYPAAPLAVGTTKPSGVARDDLRRVGLLQAGF